MQPDVLFWFYKEFDICRDRLRQFRAYNREVRVFALYGGAPELSARAERSVAPFVDDFYAYPGSEDSNWKWRHGDQLINSWYAERGRYLQWKTVFLLQWDMLVLTSLEQLFSNLKQGEILLSGYRPIEEIEAWWPWVNGQRRAEFQQFSELVRDRFSYRGGLYACLFIVACLPREFLDAYLKIGAPKTGFLEYKFPSLARVFEITVANADEFEPWWAADPSARHYSGVRTALNAVGAQVPRSVVKSELERAEGRRIFHPVFYKF